MRLRALLLASVFGAQLDSAVLAQVVPPQVQSLGLQDLFPVVPDGNVNAGTKYYTLSTLMNALAQTSNATVVTSAFGAKCNTQTFQVGATTSGATLGVSNTTFTVADVGKTIDIVGAAGAVFETTIDNVSSNGAVLDEAPPTPVTNAAYSYFNDDTYAFQQALDTGLTVYAPALGGLCHIYSVTSTTPGQKIYGDGRHRTKLYAMKPTSGLGTIVAAQGLGSWGPTIEDIGLYYYNDETQVHTTPTDFPVYPPGLYMQNQPLVTLHRVGIYGGSTCIDASAGDTGYFTIDDLEFSCWVAGINQNGAANPSYWHNLKWWQFTSNPNGCQYNCYAYPPINLKYASGNNILPAAAYQGSGRTVGLMLGKSFVFLSDSLFISGLGIYTEGGATQENLTMTNVDLDSFSGIECYGGALVTMNGGYLTVGNGNYPFAPVNNVGAIINSGCSMTFNGTIFNQFTMNGQQATIYINGGNAGIYNSPNVNMNGYDSAFVINNVGQLIMSGNYITRSNTLQPVVAPGNGEVVNTTSTGSAIFTVTGDFGLPILNGASVSSTLFPGGTTVVGPCTNNLLGTISTCTASANASAVGSDSNATITNTGYNNSIVSNTSFAALAYLTTGITGNGTTATVTYTGLSPVAYPVSSTIAVVGTTPAICTTGCTVTASTATTVSFASSITGPQTVAGYVTSVDNTNPSNTTLMGNVFAPISVFAGAFTVNSSVPGGVNRIVGNAGSGWYVGCADGTGPTLHAAVCSTQTNTVFSAN